MRKVVITGLGIVSPIGIGVDTFFKALQKGQSGVGRISLFDPSDYSVQIAAEVKDFKPEQYFDVKDTKRLDRVQQFALIAAKEAIENAGIILEKEDLEKIGVYVTSGVGGLRSIEEQQNVLMERGPRRISPFLITQLIIDAIPAYIAIKYGFKGATLSAVSACASSTQTIGEALLAIQRGDLDVIVAGGADAAITPLGVAAFASMRALSKRNDAPEKASRPFDKNRDGFIMGEGAGILILESLEHAEKRGAHIYAELSGYATTTDAYHITAPDPEVKQIKRVMRTAMQKAGITEVDYINAHGTSTPLNDKYETKAIKEVFGEKAYDISVTSTKSMIGHLLGASGVAECVATVLSIENGIIFPTINYEEKDPECDLNYVPNEAIKKDVNVVLKNSLGFGGHNISLIFKKFR
ncbi:MAG: beta-ketoacyl-[acyl-carrier-protein] synthase II [Caldiserica bacterium]|nr:MAG: beta-ketoacyl-[acyl-carrier-protein] synthase II [Caldisericota bacterium]